MFIWLIIMALAVFADQITKWLAIIFLQGGEPVEVIPWFIRFSYVENTGAAWGMFADKRWVFLTISIVAIVALLIYMFWRCPKNKLLCWSLTLIIAGGIGNMIDRLLMGYVVDFLEFTFIDFPVFNVADSCVSIGAVLLILYLIISTVKENKNAGKAKIDKIGTDDDKDNGDGGDGGNKA